jgi:hypothetical protein
MGATSGSPPRGITSWTCSVWRSKRANNLPSLPLEQILQSFCPAGLDPANFSGHFFAAYLGRRLMTHATWSNEARIQRGLDLVGCPPTNFCRLMGIGKTRFLETLGGTSRGFDDEEAQKFLSFLERLHDLQAAVNEATRDPGTGLTARIPLDFSRVEQIATALACRLAQKICLEDGDHSLDQVAQDAMNALGRGAHALRATKILMEAK